MATESIPPLETDIVVIGGGLIGTATALFLAQRGASVVLCEKGAVAGEASGRSLGQVGSSGLAPVKMELLLEAKRLWADMNLMVGAETGYRRNGSIIPFADDEPRGMFEEWLAVCGPAEPAARILTADEARTFVPSIHQWTGAFYNPTDGTAEPVLAATAFADAARRLGAKIVAPCAVRGIDIEAGRAHGVVTEAGRIRSSSVVLAGGCWSRLFCGSLGLPLPMLNVHAFCESVYGVDAGPLGSADGPGVAWRRQIDGGYTIGVTGGHVPLVPAVLRYAGRYLALLREVHWDLDMSFGKLFFQELSIPSRWSLDSRSPFEHVRILEPELSDKFVRLARSRIVEFQPLFRGMRSGEVWSGALCTPPDNTPTMSPVQSLPGLFLATGFSYGLTMAPAAGKLMADLVTGARPSIDPRPYRYERYLDGSCLEPLA